MKSCDVERVSEDRIRTEKERREMLRILARAVFQEFADVAMGQPSATFEGKTILEYGVKSIENFREVEEFLLTRSQEAQFD